MKKKEKSDKGFQKERCKDFFSLMHKIKASVKLNVKKNKQVKISRSKIMDKERIFHQYCNRSLTDIVSFSQVFVIYHSIVIIIFQCKWSMSI